MKWTTNRLSYHDKHIWISALKCYALVRTYRNGNQQIVGWKKYKRQWLEKEYHGVNYVSQSHYVIDTTLAQR